jgi:hypothetical protein
MASSVEIKPVAACEVNVTSDSISVELSDGRTIVAPLAWYPRLTYATAKERKNWRLIAGGQGIHWADLDEDISVANLLAGQPSGESRTSLAKWLASRSKRGRSTPGK